MNDALMGKLEAVVGRNNLLTEPADVAPYSVDWTTLWRGDAAAVALPESIEQVQAIVRLANEHDLAIVPSGGRTGLSGGAVAARGELVLALDRMNRILDFDAADQTLVCQGGTITADIQARAAREGLYYPVDFASAGSSRIGGNVATNAGGIHVIRYGGTREQVRGLKVVTGAGDCLDLNRGLVKNNTGPDLRHLFVGSEGTLGVICEVTLALAAPPAPARVMVVGVDRCPLLLDILADARRHLRLSAFEFFSRQALDRVVAHTGLQPPLREGADYYGLLEFDDPGEEAVLAFYENCMERGLARDAVLSQSDTQARELWRLRENITESLAPRKPLKNDIAVAISRMPAFIDSLDELLRERFPQLEAIWFGHLGDGNIHLNVLQPREWSDAAFAGACPVIADAVMAKVSEFGGSISAEHGIGLLKKPHLHHGLADAEIRILRGIKHVLDPRGIMNPGKIFDP